MKKLLYPSLILNILLIAFFVGKRIYFANSGLKTSESKEPWSDMWNRGRFSVLNKSTIDTGDVVFIGDSITEGFLVSELFGQHVKNRGISANTTRHLISRIDQIAKGHPRKVIITIGVNDLREGVPADSILYNIRSVIYSIKKESPRTSIIINSIFPTSMEYITVQNNIAPLNDSISSYCKQQGYAYVDVYSSLLKDNMLDSSFTFDGIHLNGSGYEVWKKKIASYVQ